ncbi:hypothetical protein D3C87_1840090 [compost metagenome]
MGGHLVALARRGGNIHDETTIDLGQDRAFNAAHVIQIGDDALTDDARHGRDHHGVAGRHGQDLTGKFPPVRQHVATENRHVDALKTPVHRTVVQVQGIRRRGNVVTQHASTCSTHWGNPQQR